MFATKRRKRRKTNGEFYYALFVHFRGYAPLSAFICVHLWLKCRFSAFRDIARRVNFLSCEQLVKNYEYEMKSSGSEFRL